MEPHETSPPELPEATHISMALAHLVRVLERRHPGLVDEWVEGLENDAAHAEIVRLREAREEKALIVTRQRSLTWVRFARAWVLVSLGHGRKKRRR